MVLTLASATACAAPINSRKIPASAKWVMHFDNEKARSMKITEAVMEMVEEKVGDKGTMENEKKGARKILDFHKKLKDLKSITLFGPSEKKEHAIMVVHANYDRDEVLKLVGLKKDSRSFTYRKHTVYPVCGRRHKDSLLCFYNKKTVVGGRDLDEVFKAIDVLDGAKKVEALSSKSPLARALKPSAGSAFTAAVVDVGKMAAAKGKGRRGKMKALVGKIKSASIDMGERGGSNYCSMRVTMVDKESAEQMATVARGFKAMAFLMKGRKMPEEFGRILNSIKIQNKKEVMSVEMKVSTEDMIELIKKHAERMKHHGSWKKKWHGHRKK